MSCGVVTTTGACQRNFLRQRELNVAGSRGHINDEVVQVFPIGLFQKLLECGNCQRTSPNHRLIRIDEHADGSDLQTVSNHRFKSLTVNGVRLSVMPSIVGWLGP